MKIKGIIYEAEYEGSRVLFIGHKKPLYEYFEEFHGKLITLFINEEEVESGYAQVVFHGLKYGAVPIIQQKFMIGLQEIDFTQYINKEISCQIEMKLQ